MKETTTIVLVIVAAVALGLAVFSTTAYAMMWGGSGYGGLAGQNAGYGGMMGGSTGAGGMMGGYGGGASPGGMMGRTYGSNQGGMMGGFSSQGGMMGAGSMSAAMGQMMGSSHGGRMMDSNSTVQGHGWGPNFVAIVDYEFYPANLTVAKGTAVTWVNMDFVQHTVTSGSETAPTSLFDSHELNHMQRFSYTFNTPGTYSYYCDVHPDMVGTITVTA